jgi:hypothetical protein
MYYIGYAYVKKDMIHMRHVFDVSYHICIFSCIYIYVQYELEEGYKSRERK